MLEVHEIEGVRVFNSVELYQRLGYCLVQYSRWSRHNILDHGIKQFDYFKAPDHFRSSKIPGPKPIVYYVTVDFAKALCVVAKTPASKRVRKWIYDNTF